MKYLLHFLVLTILSVPTGSAFAGAKHKKKAGVNSLDLWEHGGVLDILVAKTVASSTTLTHKQSTDGGKTWTQTSIPTGKVPLKAPGRGNDFQIARMGNRVVSVWETAKGAEYGGGPLAAAYTTDDKTWHQMPSPSDDAGTIDHGYADLTVDDSGTFHLVWLDSRAGHQGLYYTYSKDLKKGWAKNRNLVPKTCHCCWNNIRHHGEKLYVQYRGEKPRDLMLISMELGNKSSASGKISKPKNLGTFNWDFDGCPHVGGALDVGPSGALSTLIWTGHAKKKGLYFTRTEKEGGPWTAPKLMSPTGKHSDIAVNGSHMMATWVDQFENKRAIVFSLSKNNGDSWSKKKTLSKTGKSVKNPRIAYAKGNFLIAWTETTKGHSAELKTAVIPVGQSNK